MDLVSNGLSPYGRKVMVVVHELGLAGRVRLIEAQPRERPDEVIRHNRLGKIPVLITDDGGHIYDSPVICEYLDAEFGNHRLLPAAGVRRWQILTCVAAADGVIDAAILVRNERLRPPDRQSASWIAWHLEKVRRCLDAFEQEVIDLSREIDLGTIALGCALGYVLHRLEEFAGLENWPRLAGLHAGLSARPSFAKTAPAP
ncbi:MAG: glutathione S-transferase N-terminal domain-containing protein [Geminicoccales bacterium]